MIQWFNGFSILTMAIVSGSLGFYYGKQAKKTNTPKLPSHAYLKGIQYFLNEESDKAVDLFLELLDKDNATIETHFALAALFRRKGELERSIRVHQALMQKPQLDNSVKDQATLELAKDFLAAGVLDRAERLFLQRIAYGSKDINNYRYLLMIYQQEKDWYRCIQIIEGSKFQISKQEKTERAHYYCEWLLKEWENQSSETILQTLKKANGLDSNLVRIRLLYAKLYIQHQEPLEAIKEFHLVLSQSGIYLPLVQQALSQCFAALDDDSHMIDFYYSVLSEMPDAPDTLIIMLATIMQSEQGIAAAIEYVKTEITKHPSMLLMKHLVSLHSQQTYGDIKQELDILSDTLDANIRMHHRYQCSNCGFTATHFFWNCPGCHQWSTIRYE